MHPEIFSIGKFTIRSYGFMLAIGFLTGITLAARRAQKSGENPDHIYNLSIWAVISSLLGARVYYIITHYSEFRASKDTPILTRFFTELKSMFWPIGSDGQIGISGLMLYGGVICATIAVAIYLKKHKLNVLRYMDFIAPSLGLGEFFTRMGCFLNGCCFGKPTEATLGIVFPDSSVAGYYFSDVHIHPTQLYNSIFGLTICILILFLERYKRFDGFSALLFFMLYPLGRFFIDFFRHYESELMVGGMSQFQILSIIIFCGAVSAMVFLWKTAGRRKENGGNSHLQNKVEISS
ncbi:MAG: prolipoprotein diacylglyceryl transferase [Candidatus Latescibacteria bacterium]|jgi:phosphatidylglycerol---prolipoprotein diacylglyceryl transferase|nr:prolipoprotein diacylglyceryl transferase [Candidatus Latescibacterota bacterium]